MASTLCAAGVDFLYEPQVGGFFENNPTPEFDFFDSAANLLDPTNTRTASRTPGAVQASTGTSGDPSFDLSPKMLGFYVEDDWRATPRLLLNVGIRYDRDIDTYGIDKAEKQPHPPGAGRRRCDRHSHGPDARQSEHVC